MGYSIGRQNSDGSGTVQITDGTDTLLINTDGSLTATILDTALEASRGNITGTSVVNKFGTSTNMDSDIVTDIWDRANATDDQDVWLAPTAARIHQIKSTDDNDGKTGSPSATGARTVRIFGLPDWDTKEISEDITMSGTDNVATSSAFVIIYRIQVLTCGASGPNIGTITATADSDSTVTAQVQPGLGQTRMCIYGIPSTQKLYLTTFYFHLDKAGGAARADYILKETVDVENQPTVFRNIWDGAVDTAGTSAYIHQWSPYRAFEGPMIVKVSGEASANNSQGSAGFDAYLVDN